MTRTLHLPHDPQDAYHAPPGLEVSDMWKSQERNIRISCMAVCLFLAATAAAQPVQNTTRGTVYDDIPSAIAEAVEGDVIVVAPGTYSETVDFIGKGITVKSQNPTDSGTVAATILDGNGCAVSFANGEDAGSRLVGFTITGATCGIRCIGSAPTILNCRILDNTGAGSLLSEGSNPTFVNCILAGNGGAGIEILSETARATCTAIDHCTIVGNHGGIHGGAPTIANSIVRDNDPNGATPEIAGDAPVVTYCNVEGGYDGPGNIDEEPEFVLPGHWTGAGTPEATWIRGNYHLLADSPCIDAGDPAFAMAVTDTDIDGQARILCGRTDLGCDEVPQIIYITWLGHASVRIASPDTVIYVDPYNLASEPKDADLIFVTHSHFDHYSVADIAKVRKDQTKFVGPADVVKSYGSGQALAPDQTLDLAGVRVTGVAMYNLAKSNHLKSSNWVGFIVEVAGYRIYLAGDTDLTPEVKAVTDIDVAFLPISSSFTMSPAEAAEATKFIQPTLAIPYHWGTTSGTSIADAEQFAIQAACNVKIMTGGERINSETWSRDFTFLAHWKLDETQGVVASDSVGDHDGALVGDPLWQPTAGQLDGAILLDGVDDAIATPFALDPAEGVFSVFLWVKGSTPGQAILSQTDGVTWLFVDASTGALATQLKGSGRSSRDLVSSVVVADGQWHQVGLTWDGSTRALYVDGAPAVADAQGALISQTTGLRIGGGPKAESDLFWSGLIDDVRIYSRVIQP